MKSSRASGHIYRWEAMTGASVNLRRAPLPRRGGARNEYRLSGALNTPNKAGVCGSSTRVF